MNPVSATRKIWTATRLLAQDRKSLPLAPRWLRSLLPGHSPLADEEPWLVLRAIRRLEQTLHPGMRVFEYGSGGSTLFLARRAGEVVSVEHDRGFYDVVRGVLADKGISNCTYLLHEPAPLPEGEKPGYAPGTYTSFGKNCAGLSFESYVRSIEAWPDGHFDLVLVDGRSRVSCVRAALPKIRDGGLLVLDNAERPGYRAAFRLLEQYPRTDYFGVVPSNLVLYQTTIWEIRK